MIRIWILAFSLLVLAPATPQTPAPAQAKPSISDEELWAHFEKWVDGLKPLPPGQTRAAPQAYAAAMVAEGVPREEADRRAQHVNLLRRASLDRERIYWNGAFKLGGGPSAPLRLLQEAIQKVKPGRALDAGMGRGRNAIYLASVGWDTHGYDMAADGIQAAQAAAKAAGVKLTTVQAKHEDFDFGDSKWDLILCSYNYMGVLDAPWPAVFWKALKPGGMVVFQTAVPGKAAGWTRISEHWKQFHILRLEDQDPGYIDDDWGPSRTSRTVRLIARKE